MTDKAISKATSEVISNAPSNATGEAITQVSNSPAAMSAWDMTLSLLAGFAKTIEVAEAEYEEKTIAAGGKCFGPGVSAAAQLLGVLRRARKDLEPDLHRIAKSNNFPMSRR